MILVDTDVLIEILDKNSKKGEDALRRIEGAGEDITLTSLNLHEILFGLYKYADNKKIDKVKLLDVVDFTKDDATLSANLEVKAEKKGEKIPRFDVKRGRSPGFGWVKYSEQQPMSLKYFALVISLATILFAKSLCSAIVGGKIHF